MRYCAYQERCHKEVETKLKDMRMIPVARAEIIHRLIQQNFLNEERFAQSFARGKFRIKKWGRVRIVRELKLRDISAFNIKSALKEIDESAYYDTLYRLAEKKKAATSGSFWQVKKKITNHLLYKGYEPGLVYDLVREILPRE